MKRVAFLLATVLAVSSIGTRGGDDTARCGGAWRSRGRDAMLAKGANVNTPGPDGTTAIMWAAANDDLELVRALIKAGANVSLKNQFGTTALTEAAIIGSAPVIEALLKAGADPNTKNPEGETPLMAVARSRQGRSRQAVARSGRRHQRQRGMGRTDGADVGRRAEPGGDGQVPRIEGRRPQCAASSANGSARSSPSRAPRT